MNSFKNNHPYASVFSNTNYMEMQAKQHEMVLKQMGGEVLQMPSKCCYVRFQVGDFRVAYVYNINKSKRYFLERLKPYPLPLQEYENEEDVIETIKVDLEQFKNAVNSKNISSFIKVNRELNKTAKAFEDLFLYYNVETFHTEIILQKIQEIKQEISKTINDSERVYDKTEPHYLEHVLLSQDE